MPHRDTNSRPTTQIKLVKTAALACALSISLLSATPVFASDKALKMVSMAKIRNDPATAQMVLHTLMTDPKMKKMMIKEMLSDKNFMSDLDQERASQGRGG